MYWEGHLGLNTRGGKGGIRFLLGYSQHADTKNWGPLFGIGLSCNLLEPKDKSILYQVK